MPSSSLLLGFGVLAAIGAIVFAIGTSLVRAQRESVASLPSWTIDVAGDDVLTPDERIELIERLALVRQPWSIALVERAAHEERDSRVRKVAKRVQAGRIWP